VVLPEELCDRLSAAAEAESRTVSNMAKVLIQQGLDRLEHDRRTRPAGTAAGDDRFREALERQGRERPRRLRGVPRRLRLHRPAS
jgi:hypothetical protein